MIPKNSIVTKYTSGNELVNKKTNSPYSGNYYEFNNKMYSGSEFTGQDEELVKIQDSNKLLNNSQTVIFSLISGLTSQQLQYQPVHSVINTDYNSNASFLFNTNILIDNNTRFFCKKISNSLSFIIKEIDEPTYKSLQADPSYQTTYTGIYNEKEQTIDEADKQIPGVKLFVTG